jgi:hypothetical protein
MTFLLSESFGNQWIRLIYQSDFGGTFTAKHLQVDFAGSFGAFG